MELELMLPESELDFDGATQSGSHAEIDYSHAATGVR